MTPADDLPALTIPGPHATTLDWSEYWRIKYQRTEAARAERDAEIERLRAALSAAQRLQAAYKVAADVEDYPEQIEQRDVEIERLKASVRDRAASECVQYERAEVAEARVAAVREAVGPHVDVHEVLDRRNDDRLRHGGQPHFRTRRSRPRRGAPHRVPRRGEGGRT